jgi:hypothetical protein
MQKEWTSKSEREEQSALFDSRLSIVVPCSHDKHFPVGQKFIIRRGMLRIFAECHDEIGNDLTGKGLQTDDDFHP